MIEVRGAIPHLREHVGLGFTMCCRHQSIRMCVVSCLHLALSTLPPTIGIDLYFGANENTGKSNMYHDLSTCLMENCGTVTLHQT